jgi:hypothetical protein
MRTRLPLLLALLLVMALAGPAPALVPDLQARGGGTAVDLVDMSAQVLTSDNVTYHATIPIDSPGVGGEVVVREDLDTTLFYATGAKGLSIYDVTDPALPLLLSTFPFPHAQNEDVRTSADGTIVMIAADGAILVPLAPHSTGITLIDVTDPMLPTVVASSNDLVMGRGAATGTSEHTAECAVDDCSVIYGRTGRIYEADLEAGTVTPIERRWTGTTPASSSPTRRRAWCSTRWGSSTRSRPPRTRPSSPSASGRTRTPACSTTTAGRGRRRGCRGTPPTRATPCRPSPSSRASAASR